MTENNKQHSDLRIDELLKALNGFDAKETVESTDPIFSFIQTFDIKEGNRKIQCDLIYDLFCLWNKNERITKLKFVELFNRYFEMYGTAGYSRRNRHYLLNKEIVDIVKHIEIFKKEKPENKHKYKTYKKHFERFINTHQIISGDLYIESDVFYHIYDTWTYKNNMKNFLSYKKFVNISSLYFEPKNFEGSELVWFGLDSSIKQHISPQAVANWRQGRAKRGKASKVNKEDETNIIYPETQK